LKYFLLKNFNMKKIILIHGWGGNPKDNWIPWLKEELEKKGLDVLAPIMPDSENPIIEKWLEKLKDEVGEVDKNTYFVGHSIGAQAIMRYLEKIDITIGGVLFTAPWFNLLETAYDEPEEEIQIAEPWLNTAIDFEKIKQNCDNIIAIFSDNDPCVPLSDKDLFKERLNARIEVVNGQGHFDDLEYPLILDKVLELIG